MKSPITLLASLWNDFQRLDPDVKGLNRDFLTIKMRFENEGDGYLTKALPALGQSLLFGLSSGQFTCPMGFKTIPRGAIPAFLQGMFCKVFDPFTGRLLEHPDISCIKSMYEVLFMFKKYPSSPKDQESLDRKAKSEFQDNDNILRNLSIPKNVSYILNRASCYILPTLYKKAELDFRHGPGAVVEGATSNQKWQMVSNDLFNETFDTYSFSLSDVFSSYYSDQLLKKENDKLNDKRSSSSSARLISVPKNSTSRRTITIEPVLKQFLQQGLNKALRQSIDECPILSQSLSLTDQSKNSQLALEGSLTGKWDTIDLKSASDLISLELVSIVFRAFPDFYRKMMDSRSSTYTIEGDESSTEYSMLKYSGMGNATCFPVMSITCALIGICAIITSWNKVPSKELMMRAARCIRVYGDDIVVDHRYSRQVCTWLSSCGLIVNEKKSYLGGNFKESCGVDAFRGVDITPLYFRSEPGYSASSAENRAHLVSFSNSCWERGLYSLSDTIRRHVDNEELLPLVTTTSGSLGWTSRKNWSTVQRWNNHLHRFEFKAVVVKSKFRSDRLDDYPALLKFFCTSLLERGPKHLQQTAVRFKSYLTRRWVPS